MSQNATSSPDVQTLPADGGSVNARSLVMRHGSWATIGTVSNLIFAVLSSFVLARLLSPTDFGRFTVARSAASFLGLLAAFGLGTTVLKAFGAHRLPAERRKVLVAVSRVAIFTLTITTIGAVAATTVWGTVLTGGATDFQVAVIIGVATLCGGLLNLTSDIVRGLGKLAAANFLGNAMQGSTVVHMGTLSTVAALSLAIEPSWKYALAAYTASVAIAAFCGTRLVIRFFRTCDVTTAPETGSSNAADDFTPIGVLNSSWPLAAASVISFFTVNSDLFMTADFPDATSMPFYIAARRVIILLAVPMTVLNTAARGVISPLHTSNQTDQLERALRGGAALIAIPTLSAALCALCAPEFMLRLALGEGYGEGARILQILAPGQMLLVVTGSCGAVLRLTGYQRVTMCINAFAALVLVTLGPWLAGRYGAPGLATLVSSLQGSLNLVTWAVARHLTGINTFCSFRLLAGWRTLFGNRGRKNPPPGETEA